MRGTWVFKFKKSNFSRIPNIYCIQVENYFQSQRNPFSSLSALSIYSDISIRGVGFVLKLMKCIYKKILALSGIVYHKLSCPPQVSVYLNASSNSSCVGHLDQTFGLGAHLLCDRSQTGVGRVCQCHPFCMWECGSIAWHSSQQSWYRVALGHQVTEFILIQVKLCLPKALSN